MLTESGAFQPRAKPDKPDKPGKPGGGEDDGGDTTGTTAITGASWEGGLVADTTGKVLFVMGGSYYVCSASVVTDGAAGRSIVLTAAHCVYDETADMDEGFASNWMFIPNYDASPASLNKSGSFCDETQYGCWTAEHLVVHHGFASAGTFNDQAVVHDFAFAVMGLGGGGKNGSTDVLVESIVGSQNLVIGSNGADERVDAFGYPAVQKYKGKDLVYCEGLTGFDPNVGNETYKLGCEMTGGSSGGPWLKNFNPETGVGDLTSLNSYGYSGDKSMHGPKFDGNTALLFSEALVTTSNVVVVVVP